MKRIEYLQTALVEELVDDICRWFSDVSDAGCENCPGYQFCGPKCNGIKIWLNREVDEYGEEVAK